MSSRSLPTMTERFLRSRRQTRSWSWNETASFDTTSLRQQVMSETMVQTGQQMPAATEPHVQRAPLLSLTRDEEEEEGPCGARTLWSRLWLGLSGSSFIVNIVAMAIEGGGAMIAAGIIAVLVAPFVIVRQFQLQDTDTLRQVQNALRREVNRLQVENNRLSMEVTELEGQVGRLKESEQRLDEITMQQGADVDTFVELVKENRKTLDTMKLRVKAVAMQDLVSAIIDSDFDSSAHFSDQEIQILEMRMQAMPAVKVNHDLLVQKVKASDRTLESVLTLLEDMDRDDLPEEERVFQIVPENIGMK